MNELMTVNEAVLLRQRLENKILHELRAFTKATGLNVVGIRFHVTDLSRNGVPGQTINAVQVQVML